MSNNDLDLLDANLDDLADLPEFKPFPPGGHVVTIDWEQKDINQKPAIILNMTLVSTQELSNPNDKAPEAGATSNVAFILRNNDGTKNEFAEGKFKNILNALKEGGVPGNKPREIMEASNKMQCLVLTKIRTNKNTGQENLDIVSITPL